MQEMFLFFIGLGFLILCTGVTVGIISIFGYIIKISKEKIEVAPSKNNLNPNNMGKE